MTLLEGRAIATFGQDGAWRGSIRVDEAPLCLAYDAAQGNVYVAGATPTVTVVEAASRRVTATLAVPTAVCGISVAGGSVYLSSCHDPVVYALDPLTNQVVREFHVKEPASECVVVGGRLYLATGTDPNLAPAASKPVVEVVDLESGLPLKDVPVPGVYLRAVAWDGSRCLYAASNIQGKLVRLDTTTDELDDSFGVEVGRVNDIVIDPVRNIAVLSCDGASKAISVVSLAENKEIRRVSGGNGFMAAERAEDGSIRRIWVPNWNEDFVLAVDVDELLRDTSG